MRQIGKWSLLVLFLAWPFWTAAGPVAAAPAPPLDTYSPGGGGGGGMDGPTHPSGGGKSFAQRPGRPPHP